MKASRVRASATRRQFLAIGAGAIYGLSQASWADLRGAQGDPLASIDEASVRGLVGSVFVFSGENGAFRTELISIDTTAPSNRVKSSGQSRTFVLYFGVLGREKPEQATYRVRHSELGSFDLFVVPSTARNGQSILAATFSRL